MPRVSLLCKFMVCLVFRPFYHVTLQSLTKDDRVGIYRYTEEDAEAALQKRSANAPKRCRVVDTKIEAVHEAVREISDQTCKISLVTTTSKASAQEEQAVVCSTSSSADDERLRNAAQGFQPVATTTIFRRLLEGFLPAGSVSLWSLYFCLPFTLRTTMSNPHRLRCELPHVKTVDVGANGKKSSSITSFGGTLATMKTHIREELTKRLAFVGGVDLCATLKRSGRTPPPRSSPLWNASRRVRHVSRSRRASHRQLHYGPSTGDTCDILFLGA